jgi:hypothetical protein
VPCGYELNHLGEAARARFSKIEYIRLAIREIDLAYST